MEREPDSKQFLALRKLIDKFKNTAPPEELEQFYSEVHSVFIKEGFSEKVAAENK